MRTPFGKARVNPIAAYDVARVVAHILKDPTPHIGKQYRLCGPTLQTMEEIAAEYSAALGRKITYAPVPIEEWRETVIKPAVESGEIEARVGDHEYSLAQLLQTPWRQVESTGVEDVTGSKGISVREWVQQHKKDFL